MEIGKRYLTDLSQKQNKKNINEFRSINSKAAGNVIIKEFLFQKDVATWFRGTSHYHIKGANRLFNAIRDDGEQETTHRVRTCLNLIGLKPMITSKQIKFLMQLSRGNDLVFLWFLMEKHYKTSKIEPCYFSQNEQLICSAICHLDMVTTLRELDKILPRGETSCNVEMKHKCRRGQWLKESFPKRKREISAQQFVLPYFTKYNQPREYGKCLFLKEPNLKVNFKYYSPFNNPNYAVQNETNRWYANYHFNPGKRLANLIIREIIKSIFYSSEIVSSKARSTEILCDHHNTLRVVETDLKHELIAKTSDEYLKHCLTAKAKEDKANKIKNGLDNAVQQQMCLFSNQTKTAPNNDTLRTISSDCKVYDIILGEDEYSKGDCNTPTNCESFINEKMHPSMEKCTLFAFQRNKLNMAQRSVQNSNRSYELHKKRYNDVNETPSSSSDIFFERPFMHQPHKFDYHEIFAKFKYSEESDIRKIIMKAVNENATNLPTEITDSQIFYDDFVRKYVQKIFEKTVERYEVAHVDENSPESSRPLNKYPSSDKYDAENFDLMDQMLFEAFQHLRKNPKFVWAQLPDAHKVPFLREWIAHRFGKEYSPAEKAKSYHRSCLIFRALERSNMIYSFPNANRIGKNYFVDYNCRKHVERKAQQLKSKFYHCLDTHLLEHTRVFWFAMRGYICSNGPPRKSFYAYMPSRLQDIQHHCLWKSSEYRNNWNSWNIRCKKGAC